MAAMMFFFKGSDIFIGEFEGNISINIGINICSLFFKNKTR